MKFCQFSDNVVAKTRTGGIPTRDRGSCVKVYRRPLSKELPSLLPATQGSQRGKEHPSAVLSLNLLAW